MKPTNTETTTPTQKTVPSPQPQKSNPLLIALILLLIGTIGGYYFGTQKTILSPNPTPSGQAINPMYTEPKASPQPQIELPTGWTWKTSEVCNADIPLPPKKDPYYKPKPPTASPGINDEGAYWTYEERAETDNPNPLFTHHVYTWFRNPEAMGSGYIPGAVTIDCAPNTTNETTDSWFLKYQKGFTDAEGLTIEKTELRTQWSKEVGLIWISGGMYDLNNPEYIFATSKHLYHITNISMSPNPFVKETTDKIFKNLTFRD